KSYSMPGGHEIGKIPILLGQPGGSCARRQSKQTMVARKDAQRTGQPVSSEVQSGWGMRPRWLEQLFRRKAS
ncbi:hypothetical protein D918_08304, partial [Trichuris suis]